MAEGYHFTTGTRSSLSGAYSDERENSVERRPSFLKRVGEYAGKVVRAGALATIAAAYAASSSYAAPQDAGAKKKKRDKTEQRDKKKATANHLERAINESQKVLDNVRDGNDRQEVGEPQKKKKKKRPAKSDYELSGSVGVGFGTGDVDRSEGRVGAGIRMIGDKNNPSYVIDFDAYTLGQEYGHKISGDDVKERDSAGRFGVKSSDLEVVVRAGREDVEKKGREGERTEESGVTADVSENHEENARTNFVSLSASGPIVNRVRFNTALSYNGESVDYDENVVARISGPFPTVTVPTDVETKQRNRSYTLKGGIEVSPVNGVWLGPVVKATGSNVTQEGHVNGSKVIDVDDNYHMTGVGGSGSVNLLDRFWLSGEGNYNTGDIDSKHRAAWRAAVTASLSDRISVGAGAHSVGGESNMGSFALSVDTGKLEKNKVKRGENRIRNTQSLDNLMTMRQLHDVHGESSTDRQKFWEITDGICGFNGGNLVLHFSAGEENGSLRWGGGVSVPFNCVLDGLSLDGRAEHVGGDHAETEYRIGPTWTWNSGSGGYMAARAIGTRSEDAGDSDGAGFEVGTRF